MTGIDITLLLWLCYVHNWEHPDLPVNALESLRKFPEFVEIIEPNSNVMRPYYVARLTKSGREYCEMVMRVANYLVSDEV